MHGPGIMSRELRSIQTSPQLLFKSLYGLCLFDIFNVAMSGENKTFIFLFVRIPKLSSLGVKRARAVD